MQSNEKLSAAGGTAKNAPLTDAERHARFVETAREVKADESEEAFDRAFKAVLVPPKR